MGKTEQTVWQIDVGKSEVPRVLVKETNVLNCENRAWEKFTSVRKSNGCMARSKEMKLRIVTRR